jgi:hypothetical protein
MISNFSELFFAGMIVSVIGCIIKVFKLCILNCRQVEIFGTTIYNSTLYESFVNRQQQSNSNASSSNTLNPMRPTGLLNTVV